MNEIQTRMRWRATQIFRWILVILGFLALINACAAVTGFFKTVSQDEAPVEDTRSGKRVPLPPLIKDYQ